MTEADDRALAARMAGGDETALAALYDRWGARVHAVASWILRDPDEAEDIVEETFWHAWQSAAKYDSRRGGVATWLVLIARSRALDRLRRRRRRLDRLAAGLAGASFAGPEGDGASGARAEDGADDDELRAALAALPDEQREALELAFFGGLSHGEIAAHLGRPLGTVKTRIRLALEKLRRSLAHPGGCV